MKRNNTHETADEQYQGEFVLVLLPVAILW